MLLDPTIHTPIREDELLALAWLYDMKRRSPRFTATRRALIHSIYIYEMAVWGRLMEYPSSVIVRVQCKQKTEGKT